MSLIVAVGIEVKINPDILWVNWISCEVSTQQTLWFSNRKCLKIVGVKAEWIFIVRFDVFHKNAYYYFMAEH